VANTDAAAAAASRQLKLSTILAFACTSLPLSALTIAMAVYLPRHFAAEIGISLAAVGSEWRWTGPARGSAATGCGR